MDAMLQAVEMTRKLKPFLSEALGVKTLLSGFIVLMSLVFVLVNWFGPRYVGVSFFSNLPLKLFPGMLMIWVASCYLNQKSPRLSFFLSTLCSLYFITLVIDFLCVGAQLTPFGRHDLFFARLDHSLGFNLVAVLNWTYRHPGLYHFFTQIYYSLGYELLIVPILLALFYERRNVDVFFLSVLFSCIIGFAIYYFFPTTDPAGALHDKHFLNEMYTVVLRFNRVHHHQPVLSAAGGLIGFPSFHVIWAIMLTYVCRHRKCIFYPVALFNIFVILSTMALGWHFLSDVLGGIIVVSMALFLAEKVTLEAKNQPVLSVSELVLSVIKLIRHDKHNKNLVKCQNYLKRNS